MEKNRIIKYINKSEYLIIFIVSIIICTLVSYTTSPLFNAFLVDSEIFKMLGRMANKGLVPYIDFFDHKGPFIITIEQIGDLISKNRIGIFIVQIMFWFASLIGCYKTFHLFLGKRICLAFTLVIAIILGIYNEGGNFTEEYCLPFLVFSLYLFLKATKNKNSKYNVYYSLFYGITFGACAFTRLTNAFPIVAVEVTLVIFLCNKRLWKQIFKNMGLFICGLLLFVLPYVIFFISQNALKEMIYATFIYNFRHGGDYAGLGINVITLIPLVCCLVVGITTLVIDRKNSLGMFVVISTIMAMILHLKMRDYLHYYIVYLPIFIATIISIFSIYSFNKTIKKIVIFISIIFICSFVWQGIGSAKEVGYNLIHQDEYDAKRAEMRKIVRNIDDKEHVLGYKVRAEFYLTTNIIPCYRFFTCQKTQLQYDDELRRSFMEDLKTQKAKYIVTPWDLKDEPFLNYIKSHYREKDKTDRFILYKLK